MKTFVIILNLLLLANLSMAQVPQNIKYQAAARDVDNTPIKNREIAIRLTVLKGNPQGEEVYRELHQATTSDLGIFSFYIGNGVADISDFEMIEWGANDFFLQIEMDADGDGVFSLMGISQFVSVPYALYAEQAGSAANDLDTDPGNEIQSIAFDDLTNELIISGANRVQLPAIPLNNDDDSTNELQRLSLVGTQISISDGNTIDLVNLLSSVDTDDQTLSLNGTTLTILDGNSVDLSLVQDGVDDADNNPQNEIQNLSLTGTTLRLSSANAVDISGAINSLAKDDQRLFLGSNDLLSIENGNTVDLSGLRDGVNDADSDPTNELQNLSLSGTEIFISNGVGIDLASVIQNNTDDQTLALIGTNLRIENGNAVDLSSLITPNGSDDQNLFLSGTLLSIENGNELDLSILQDGVNDADSSPSNELIQGMFLNNSILNIIEGGLSRSVDLSGLGNSVWTRSLDTAIYQQGAVRVMDNFFADDDIYLGDPANPSVRIYSPLDNVIQTPWGIDVFDVGRVNSAISLRADWSGAGLYLNDAFTNSNLLAMDNYDPYGGAIRLSNKQGSNRVVQNVTNVDNGALSTFGANGSANVVLTSYDNAPSTGVVTVYNSSGLPLGKTSEMGVLSDEGGYFLANGPNLQYNNLMTSLEGFPNHGYIGVYGASGNQMTNEADAYMYVDENGRGRIEADLKNFVTDHPKDPSKEIVYTSLEGPEAGAYERGTASIINGEVFVNFSEHFQLIINESSLTVNLTPLSADTYGLAVVEKTAEGFRVKELKNGTGSFAFDWEAKAVRRGYEDLEVIRTKGKYVPSRAPAAGQPSGGVGEKE